MSGKVTLNIVKGNAKTTVFKYEESEPRVFVGRKDDCAIIISDDTVSKYHCMLEIFPPKAFVSDLGSLNGSFVNERLIGKRDRNQSSEEGRKLEHERVELNDGDILRIGKHCEIRVTLEKKEPADIRKQAEALAGEMAAMARNIEIQHREEQKKDKKEHKEKQGGTADNDNKKKAEETGFGSLKGSDYEVISELGKGGYGTVYKVREKKTGNFYAMKVLNNEVDPDEYSAKTFIREMDIGLSIYHKNIIRTRGTGKYDGKIFMLMDLYEGGSVMDYIKKTRRPMSVNQATYIILQCLDGLDYLHHADYLAPIDRGNGEITKMLVKGIVHRDINPNNIFLKEKSEKTLASIADLGLSKAFECAGLSDVSKTGYSCGTPQFMSRQQALNCKYSEPEVDCWSIMACYYSMLTAQFPKDFPSFINPWDIAISRSAVPIRERMKSIPVSMAKVIDRALTEVPEIGYKSADKLREDLVKSLPEEVKEYCREVL